MSTPDSKLEGQSATRPPKKPTMTVGGPAEVRPDSWEWDACLKLACTADQLAVAGSKLESEFDRNELVLDFALACGEAICGPSRRRKPSAVILMAYRTARIVDIESALPSEFFEWWMWAMREKVADNAAARFVRSAAEVFLLTCDETDRQP